MSSPAAAPTGAASRPRPRLSPATDRPVAASSALRPALSPAPAAARGTVLAVCPSAMYVEVTADVLAVVSRDGLRLPNALVLPQPGAQAPFAVHRPGAPAEVVEGRLRVATASGPPVTYRPVRWWDPRRAPPRPPGEVRRAAVDALARELARSCPSASPAGPPASAAAAERLAAATADLQAALRRRDAGRACASADALIGLGAGLTPAGDDVLAGVLVTCRQLAATRGAEPVRAVADALGHHVEVRAPTRTPALSAALLRHAADGLASPPVLGVVDALIGRRALAPALADLLAVGHTSGHDTARGVLVAALALLPDAPHPPEDS